MKRFSFHTTTSNMLTTILLLCILNSYVNCAALQTVGVQNALQNVPANGRPLIIKSFPAIENYQSDLYEVYAQPYSYSRQLQDLHTISAVAVLQPEGESGINGEIVFLQRHPPAGPTLIRGNITGLPAGKHGVHIHQAGDLRQGCEKLGEHFNPYLLQHGGPADPIRHVGDLGNINVADDGTAELNYVDPIISLSGGPRGVIGRAVVITADEDNLGRGGSADSLIAGDSGKPIACGVIAYIR